LPGTIISELFPRRIPWKEIVEFGVHFRAVLGFFDCASVRQLGGPTASSSIKVS
jgi:hypothetical protein